MNHPDLRATRVRLDPRCKADVLLVPVVCKAGKPALPVIPGLTDDLRARLRDLVGRYHGAKTPGAIDDLILPSHAPFARLALVCLGEQSPARRADILAAAGSSIDWCGRHKADRAALAADALIAASDAAAVAAWVEGAALARFRYLALRSKPPENNLPGGTILLIASAGRRDTALRPEIDRALIVAQSVNLARRLGHEPPNRINPVTLAATIRAIARENRLQCRIIDHREMLRRGMGAILAVGQGSAAKPRMIIIEYRPSRRKLRHPVRSATRRASRGADRPVVLVGKAVTLDSGGYSIKPAASIPDMKYDKCGGMAVIATLVAAARLKLQRHLVGIIGAAENMISGEAFRPGDIVTAASGTTIEVGNTDAEGRMVLADCLHYARTNYDPAAIIDLATLTGACEVALGDACAGLFANDDALAQALTESGERTGDRLWRLPLWPVYRDLIVGTDGDIKNAPPREGGAITAAKFLEEFVDPKTPWAHLDIAGVATTEKQKPTCPPGATGFGVRLLLDYLTNVLK